MTTQTHHYSENILSMLCKDVPFAWFLFDQSKKNSRYKLVDFKEQAERLEAHLDALSVALSDDEDIQAWLAPDDWGSCFVLAVLGIRHNDSALFDAALDNLNETEETHYREIVDACLWDKQADISTWFVKLLKHDSPVAQQSAVAISRLSPQPMPADIFNVFLENNSAVVRSQFLNWLGEHPQQDQLTLIQSHYGDSNSLLAFSAARAGFLLGDVQGKNHLEKFALGENSYMLDAITLIFIKEDNQQLVRGWIEKLWSTPTISIRVKLYAVSIAGLPEYVDKLFQPMVDDETSRAAGEAFSTLTGADIEFDDLDAMDACADCGNEDEIDPSLAKKREDDPFISDWEDGLPYPCPDASTDWWQQQRLRFHNGTQYLAGLETTQDNLKTVLSKGNQRQRQLAALHLFIKHDSPWLDCSWPPEALNNHPN